MAANVPLSANVAAGHYTALCTRGAFTNVNLGKIDQVRRLRRRMAAQLFQTDQYGDCDIDGVYRGGNVSLTMTFKEWTPQIRNVLWPADANFGDVGIVGRMLTSMAGSLTLTPVAGTPAAALCPQSILIPYIQIAPENDQEFLMGNIVRDVPVVFKVFPFAVDDTANPVVVRWFTLTQS